MSSKEIQKIGIMDVENQQNVLPSSHDKKRLQLENDILDYLSLNKAAHFTNVLTGEPELDRDRKRVAAHKLLTDSYGLFLARFGTYLQEKHLVYFDSNVSEDEKYIVDIHLKQLRKIYSNKTKSSKCSEKMELNGDLSPQERIMFDLRSNILDHLAQSNKAYFKSQQFGEPELDMQQKRDIAEELLDRSSSLFLSRFGTHLEEKHLRYFEVNNGKESYEVDFYLKELKRNHCKKVSMVDIKNRRFEALRQMLDEGSYFGETEMRKRNPLLYEQMIGQFLTDEEKRERENIDTTNITFVNLLLEQIDRDAERKLKHQQIEEEDDVMEEEEDTSDDDEEEVFEKKPIINDEESTEDVDIDKTLWGESYTDREQCVKTIGEIKQSPVKESKPRDVPELSESEKQLLMEEFRSNMFESFLQGKDDNFDYSQVDFNPDYDDLVVRGLDEEEKYFDAESPEEVSLMDFSGEDELDQYMVNLKPEPNTDQLADQMKNLNKQ